MLEIRTRFVQIVICKMHTELVQVKIIWEVILNGAKTSQTIL